MQLSDQFRQHFGHRDHLYGVMLEFLADDLDSGGPTAEICGGKLDAVRGDAIQLRLLAGIFRTVLRGDAPRLAGHYPCLGGTPDQTTLWSDLRPVLAAHVDELRGALDLAPQTNEVGRAACLAVGLFTAVRRHGLRKIRLLEPGASAGLNLNVDRYHLTGPGWSWGPGSVAGPGTGSVAEPGPGHRAVAGDRGPLTLDSGAAGVRPEPFTVVERRGCDLSPVDVSTPAGATYLRSFVWPFHLERHQRLAAAIEVARQHPVTVDRAPASSWIVDQLGRAVPDDVLTVVWQSITQQYWPAEESAAVADAVAEARTRIPLAHIVMEGVPPVQGTDGYAIEHHGPITTVDGIPVARSHHHGPPVLLTDPEGLLEGSPQIDR